MAPDISEFSYGFALTHEIVNRFPPLKIAPIFPSLSEEGKAGGGYDLKIGHPSFPIFLQFKLSHKMVRETAAEIKTYNLPIDVPFYRFSIMDSHHSRQHDMLLSLDQAGSEVFYAAPRFHTHEELNAAFSNSTVATQSSFVRPRTIGALPPGKHSCAVVPPDVFVCSEPFSFKHIGAHEFEEALAVSLRERPRIFGPELVMEILGQYERASERLSDPDKEALRSYDDFIERTPVLPFPGSGTSHRPIRLRYDELVGNLRQSVYQSKGTITQLSKLSEFSTNVFGLQFFVVQQA
jgi:hypothetical protein